MEQLLDAMEVPTDDRPCWSVPWQRSTTMTEADAVELTGNGMHAAVAGSVMGWALAFCIPHWSCGYDGAVKDCFGSEIAEGPVDGAASGSSGSGDGLGGLSGGLYDLQILPVSRVWRGLKRKPSAPE